MHTRDFSTAQCVVYASRPDKAKVAVDWNTLSSYLAGSEVNQITYMYTRTIVHAQLSHCVCPVQHECFSAYRVRHLEKYYIYMYMYSVCAHNVHVPYFF